MVGREHEQRTRSPPRFPDQRWREHMKSGERNPPATAPPPISELSERSREIFRLIVDGYVQTGEPIGSRTLSRLLGQHLSPATIGSVMGGLEGAGLLYSPHTSAGRLPTEAGLRLFVHGLLEIGNLAEDERQNIESLCAARGKSLAAVCPAFRIAPASSAFRSRNGRLNISNSSISARAAPSSSWSPRMAW